MPITLSQLEIVDANPTQHDFSDFDCDDADLNDFLRNDCHKFQALGLSCTKLALLDGRIVGYITLLADSISLEITERKWLLDKNVTIQHVPALKVGRLGTSVSVQRQGCGKALMQYAVGVAHRIAGEIKVGCRYLTVDAYPASVDFYSKVGFVFSAHSTYKKRKYPSMHYDLIAGRPMA